MSTDPGFHLHLHWRVPSQKDCQHCGYGDGTDGSELRPMEIDHRIPRWWGGTDAPWNLQRLCAPCHNVKTWIENRISHGEGGFRRLWLSFALPVWALNTDAARLLPLVEVLDHMDGHAACCGCDPFGPYPGRYMVSALWDLGSPAMRPNPGAPRCVQAKLHYNRD